jgi:hypothetical protein
VCENEKKEYYIRSDAKRLVQVELIKNRWIEINKGVDFDFDFDYEFLAA